MQVHMPKSKGATSDLLIYLFKKRELWPGLSWVCPPHREALAQLAPKTKTFLGPRQEEKERKWNLGWVPLKNSDPAETPTHTQNPARQ